MGWLLLFELLFELLEFILTALCVACLSSENPESEHGHLQIYGGVSGGCPHGGEGEVLGTCLSSILFMISGLAGKGSPLMVGVFPFQLLGWVGWWSPGVGPGDAPTFWIYFLSDGLHPSGCCPWSSGGVPRVPRSLGVLPGRGW